MTIAQTVVLLPCFSLEDLSLDHNKHEAEQLLAAWATLFHPLVVHHAQCVPTWARADAPPDEPADKLIVLPDCSAELVPPEWLANAENNGTRLFRGFNSVDDLLQCILATLPIPPEQPTPPTDLAEDFLALGFCHLLVELLTRQLRYMSNLDEVRFESEVTEAATEAVTGGESTARKNLREAFDRLTEAREYFYPVEANLLDLTLVAPTTLGTALRNELTWGKSTEEDQPRDYSAPAEGAGNVLLSAQTLETIARDEPETLEALREAIANDKVGLAGGAYNEGPWPLMPLEAVLDELNHALTVYQHHLGSRPTIFARRRFGLSPALPGILAKLGYAGAFHVTLDDGRFPTSHQSKIRWEGGARKLEALSRVPIQADRPDVLLKLTERLGDVMDLDHAATIVLAHWPGQASRWHDYLRRIHRYSVVLGRFVKIETYFADTKLVGQDVAHAADRYRSPYLRQAVATGQVDPLSRWVRYHRRRALTDSLRGVIALADLLADQVARPRASGDGHGEQHEKPLAPRPSCLGDVPPEVEALAARAEAGLSADDGGPIIEKELFDASRGPLSRLASLLPRSPDASNVEEGLLAINPWSRTRRAWVDLSPSARLPDLGGPILAAAEEPSGKRALVEIPPMGFAWIGQGGTSPRHEARGEQEETPSKTSIFGRRKSKPTRPEPPLVEENRLQNEFFRVTIDPITGALRSLHDYHTRGSRLAQQIALRFGVRAVFDNQGVVDEEAETLYSIMAAEQIKIVDVGPVTGRLLVRGRLVDRQGQRVAGFEQSIQIRRGSRVLRLDMTLDIDRPPADDPWDSYYAARFAWSDATADISRSVHQQRHPTDARLLEAPHYIDLQTPRTRTTLLTAGLPYHRRLGLRKLDSLLSVRGETCRRFTLGVGIDLEDPLGEAMAMLEPPLTRVESQPTTAASGWLFHVGAKNVMTTALEPIRQADGASGYRTRLLETEGRPARTRLQAFRPIRSAWLIDFQGNRVTTLPVENDAVTITLAPREWIAIEVAYGSSQ